MPAKATGRVEPYIDEEGRQRFKARIRLKDGSRPQKEVPLDHCKSEETARRWAALMQKGENKHGLLLKEKLAKVRVAAGESGELASKWFGRYFEWRDGRGFVTADATKARLTTYALPFVEGKAMGEIVREDIEAIVRGLDARVEDEEAKFTWKTAANVWGDVTRAFDEAVNSKDRSLRVLTKDPSDGVRGPDRGDTREKPFLFPTEIVALLSCEAVPLYWRRLYAVAAYTGARSNELAALTAADVDLEHNTINISKQIDRETGLPKVTKTRRVRSIEIEPELLPLIKVLVKSAGDGRLLRMPPDEDRAELLRRHLTKAGCTRPALSADDELRSPMVFHGLRDTCLSHMAVRGDEPLKIQWRAGHTIFATTQRYIEQARKAAGTFGEPFPPLPSTLIHPTRLDGGLDAVEGSTFHLPVTTDKNLVTPMGIEPGFVCENQANSAEFGAVVSPDDPLNLPAIPGVAQPPSNPRPIPTDALDAALARAIDAALAAGDLLLVSRIIAQVEARQQRVAGNVIPFRRVKA